MSEKKAQGPKGGRKQKQEKRRQKYLEGSYPKVNCVFTPNALMRCIVYLHTTLCNMERSVKSSKFTSFDVNESNKGEIAASFSSRIAALPPSQQKFMRSERSHLVKEVFGTQEPTVRIRSDPVTDGYTVGIVDVNVFSCDYQSLHDQGSWAALFDEYIMLSGHVHWFSYLDALQSNDRGLAIGVIDYDDNTALTTIANLMAYDTHKVFCPATSLNKVHSWPWHIQYAPDMAWTTTSSNFTPCYFKWNAFGATATIATGYTIWFDAEVMFRQVEV